MSFNLRVVGKLLSVSATAAATRARIITGEIIDCRNGQRGGPSGRRTAAAAARTRPLRGGACPSGTGRPPNPSVPRKGVAKCRLIVPTQQQPKSPAMSRRRLGARISPACARSL
ncbi:hypothetical protein ISCGN_000232 [Ixodes scapularis]